MSITVAMAMRTATKPNTVKTKIVSLLLSIPERGRERERGGDGERGRGRERGREGERERGQMGRAREGERELGRRRAKGKEGARY